MNNLVMRVLKYDSELTPIHVEGDKYVFKYENNIVAAVVIDDDMMLMYTSSKYEDYVVKILNPLKNIVLFVNMKRKVHIECKYNELSYLEFNTRYCSVKHNPLSASKVHGFC